jgi:hypothetical protein
MLMRRIEPFYKSRAARLFQILRAAREQNDRVEKLGEKPLLLTLLALSFADDNDPNLAFTSGIKHLTELELSIRCNTMEDRLKVRCAGLLEVQGASKGDPVVQGATDGDLEASRLQMANVHGRVQYLHRTVRDYLEQPTVWPIITAMTDNSDFDPNIWLLKCCLLQLKTNSVERRPEESPETLPNAMWRCAALGLEHSRQAELNDSPAYIALLDQLDLVMMWHIQQKGDIYPGHWARYYLSGYDLAWYERPIGWADSILTLAVEYSLCGYLEYKFRQTSNTPFENVYDKPGRPLLDYAVSQRPQDQHYPNTIPYAHESLLFS